MTSLSKGMAVVTTPSEVKLKAVTSFWKKKWNIPFTPESGSCAVTVNTNASVCVSSATLYVTTRLVMTGGLSFTSVT